MREINYTEVVVSMKKGNKKITTHHVDTWVIGKDTTLPKINTNPKMMKQIEDNVYPSKYKGVRKVVVIKIVSTKKLGYSFYYH